MFYPLYTSFLFFQSYSSLAGFFPALENSAPSSKIRQNLKIVCFKVTRTNFRLPPKYVSESCAGGLPLNVSHLTHGSHQTFHRCEEKWQRGKKPKTATDNPSLFSVFMSRYFVTISKKIRTQVYVIVNAPILIPCFTSIKCDCGKQNSFVMFLKT